MSMMEKTICMYCNTPMDESWALHAPHCRWLKDAKANPMLQAYKTPGGQWAPETWQALEERHAARAARKVASDGSAASYYELPNGAAQLQHLISHRNMNAQIGEIFRACYRYGMVEHSPEIRDIKKIIFYAQAELERLEKQHD